MPSTIAGLWCCVPLRASLEGAGLRLVIYLLSFDWMVSCACAWGMYACTQYLSNTARSLQDLHQLFLVAPRDPLTPPPTLTDHSTPMLSAPSIGGAGCHQRCTYVALEHSACAHTQLVLFCMCCLVDAVRALQHVSSSCSGVAAVHTRMPSCHTCASMQ